MMAAKFYQSIESGSIFNSLIENEAGVWMISYERPAAPFFVSWRLIEAQYERAQTPQQYVEYANRTIYNKGNRQVIGRIDKKCRESDNVRMTYVNDDSDG